MKCRYVTTRDTNCSSEGHTTPQQEKKLEMPQLCSHHQRIWATRKLSGLPIKLRKENA